MFKGEFDVAKGNKSLKRSETKVRHIALIRALTAIVIIGMGSTMVLAFI